MKKIGKLLTILILLNVFTWHQIVFGGENRNTEFYFLDVGQGDSELVRLPNNVKILIDGGPNNKILSNLDAVLSTQDRYIDLVILSHPEYDHFAGLIEVLKRYEVGAFINNGRVGTAKAFADLKNIVEKSNTPVVVLAEGDKIKYQNKEIQVISPSKEILLSKSLNDTALVLKFIDSGFSALFTGDIGKKIENYLAVKYDLKSDILKIPHHGSKNSSSELFINEVSPRISVIEVGKNNYGHPTNLVLARLFQIGSKIFRTDKDGIIKIAINNGKIDIFNKKP